MSDSTSHPSALVRRILQRIALAMGLIAGLQGALANEFLDPDQAFRPRVETRQDRQLVVSWEIAEGYKLYKESLSATATAPGPTLPELVLPKGKRGFDAALGKEVTTLQGTVTGTLTLPTGAGEFNLEVGYQGCALDGFCYSPQIAVFRVSSTTAGGQPRVQVDDTTTAAAVGATNEDSMIRGLLSGGNLPLIAGSFLLFGLLLSFTPCVLPMIPILSSIIVGQGSPGRRRSFLLAVSYALGMAVVYTGMGVAAGLVGEGLAAFMQHPWVLAAFALLLTAFALSMFDVYQLQLPAAWQGRASELSARLPGGRHLGVFAMGAVSSLIVGPCVAGPLAGALLYISQTRDVLLGGLALFAMACGMSVPLLLTGLSAGSLLPRAGAWMNHVKTVFGLLLLAVALWMINPLLGESVRLLAWGALLVLAAFCTPLLAPRTAAEGFAGRLGRALGVLVLVTGLAEIWGGLTGNTDPLAPLRQPGAVASTPESRVRFERISGLKALHAALRESDRPVVLDFYADWCASCLEMERLTFRDPDVIERMRSVRVLQVDVTRNTAEDRELMRTFRLFGPPALLFFGRSGEELRDLRLIGFMGAAPFRNHLDRFTSPGRG